MAGTSMRSRWSASRAGSREVPGGAYFVRSWVAAIPRTIRIRMVVLPDSPRPCEHCRRIIRAAPCADGIRRTLTSLRRHSRTAAGSPLRSHADTLIRAGPRAAAHCYERSSIWRVALTALGYDCACGNCRGMRCRCTRPIVPPRQPHLLQRRRRLGKMQYLAPARVRAYDPPRHGAGRRAEQRSPAPDNYRVDDRTANPPSRRQAGDASAVRSDSFEHGVVSLPRRISRRWEPCTSRRTSAV